jgi:hypothetical protein
VPLQPFVHGAGMRHPKIKANLNRSVLTGRHTILIGQPRSGDFPVLEPIFRRLEPGSDAACALAPTWILFRSCRAGIHVQRENCTTTTASACLYVSGFALTTALYKTLFLQTPTRMLPEPYPWGTVISPCQNTVESLRFCKIVSPRIKNKP